MKKGFTLVEILIVVTIIAVLSVIAITSFSSINSKTKDVKKKADIDALANAYELKYNAKNRAYQALTEADFSGPIPSSPAYSEPIATPVPAFRICANLASDTESCSTSSSTCYCKQSIHEARTIAIANGGGSNTPPAAVITAPTPTPTPLPACSSGFPEGQAFSTDLRICVGYKTFDTASTSCNSGYHVCTLNEFLSAGGSNRSPLFSVANSTTSNAWLSSTAGTDNLTCTSSMCGTSTCTAWSAGNTSGIGTNAGKDSMASSCSEVTTANTGYFSAFTKTSLLPGVACCKGSSTTTPTPTPTPAPTPATYTLAQGYSETQGKNNWYYYWMPEIGGSPTQATYTSSYMQAQSWFGQPDNVYWTVANTWMYVDPTLNTAGDSEIALIYWKAPGKGTAAVTATEQRIEPSGKGNGFTFGINYISSVGTWPSSFPNRLFVPSADTAKKTLTLSQQMQGNGDTIVYFKDSNPGGSGDTSGQCGNAGTCGDTSNYTITINFTPN